MAICYTSERMQLRFPQLNAVWLMLYYEAWAWLGEMFRWTNQVVKEKCGWLRWLANRMEVSWHVGHLATWAGKYNGCGNLCLCELSLGIQHEPMRCTPLCGVAGNPEWTCVVGKWTNDVLHYVGWQNEAVWLASELMRCSTMWVGR